jgi:hypothetical protein
LCVAICHAAYTLGTLLEVEGDLSAIARLGSGR